MASGDNILWIRKSHRFYLKPIGPSGHHSGFHWLWFYIVLGTGK